MDFELADFRPSVREFFFESKKHFLTIGAKSYIISGSTNCTEMNHILVEIIRQ